MTSSIYNLKWLIDKFDRGEAPKLLFFWGHANKLNETVGKFCFSQWYELPFVVDGITYKTAEHWMMAQKALLFNDAEMFEQIIDCRTPGEAKKLGRQVSGFDEDIWTDARFDTVVNGNIEKFKQNPPFAEYLLKSGERVLVEASPRDRIWGIGLSQHNDQAQNPNLWRGQNLLGFALMEVRDKLRG